jgi:hypothetical protein
MNLLINGLYEGLSRGEDHGHAFARWADLAQPVVSRACLELGGRVGQSSKGKIMATITHGSLIFFGV